jgi:hypothetical protein
MDIIGKADGGIEIKNKTKQQKNNRRLNFFSNYMFYENICIITNSVHYRALSENLEENYTNKHVHLFITHSIAKLVCQVAHTC